MQGNNIFNVTLFAADSSNQYGMDVSNPQGIFYKAMQSMIKLGCKVTSCRLYHATGFDSKSCIVYLPRASIVPDDDSIDALTTGMKGVTLRSLNGKYLIDEHLNVMDVTNDFRYPCVNYETDVRRIDYKCGECGVTHQVKFYQLYYMLSYNFDVLPAICPVCLYRDMVEPGMQGDCSVATR